MPFFMIFCLIFLLKSSNVVTMATSIEHDDLCDLGIMFYKNGSWNRTQKCISEYGSYALHNLYRLLQDMDMKTTEKI